MVVVILSDDQLSAILADLAAYSPMSCMMETMLFNTINNVCAWPGVEYIVDQFPNWNVCACRPNLDSPKSVNRCRQYSVSFFAKTPADLERFLEEPDVLRWDKPIHFYGVRRPEEYDIVRRKCLAINPVLSNDNLAFAKVFLLEQGKITTKPLPDGLRLGVLGSEHGDYVKENWGWTDEETKPYIDFLLDPKNGFPTAAVFDEKTGQPVAHITYTSDGALGLGFVHPDYRSRGLFQIVLYAIAQKIFALGHKFTFGYVFQGKDASVRCFRRMVPRSVRSLPIGSLPHQRLMFLNEIF